MRHVLRPLVCACAVLTLALAIVGTAAVASAQQVCVALTVAPPSNEVVVFRLDLIPAGATTFSLVGSVVGASTLTGAGVLSGAGVLAGGQAELSIQGTNVTASATPQAAELAQHSTHVVLSPPSFASGTFRHILVPNFVTSATQTFGQTTTVNAGTAAIIPCPPQS